MSRLQRVQSEYKNACRLLLPRQFCEVGGEEMSKYRCTVCGYIYDPAVGDDTQGIKPGTAFEDIPDTWTCPVCGVPKSDFVKED